MPGPDMTRRKSMDGADIKGQSTSSESSYQDRIKLSNIGSLGVQLNQLEAHLKRSSHMLEEKDKTIAQLKDTVKALSKKFDEDTEQSRNMLKEAKLEFDRTLSSKEDEWKAKFEEQRAKFEIEIEGTKIKQNSDILKLAKDLRNEMESVEGQLSQAKEVEEELSRENQKLKGQVLEVGRALMKYRETVVKLESQLHNLRLEHLKEANTKDRLLDELKRASKEIARLTEGCEQLRKRADRRQSDIGQKVNEIHKMFVLNSTRKVEEDVVNARLDLASLAKGQAALLARLEELDRFQRFGGRPTASVGVQTVVSGEKMKEYEDTDRETVETIMRLREELVDCKTEVINTKQQNEVLRQVVRELKRCKEEADEAEEEDAARIGALEQSVLELRDMLKATERPAQESAVHINEELEGLKKELGVLKRRQRTAAGRQQHVAETTAVPKQPIKLRVGRPFESWN